MTRDYAHADSAIWTQPKLRLEPSERLPSGFRVASDTLSTGYREAMLACGQRNSKWLRHTATPGGYAGSFLLTTRSESGITNPMRTEQEDAAKAGEAPRRL